MSRYVALLTLLAGHVAASDALGQEQLRLEDVYRAVREQNPRLRAVAAVVQARRALEPGAGLPPDPQVEIGAMNLSLPGFSADMPTSMAPSIQLMQMLPLFGKLGLSERIAQQSTEIAQADANEAWWEVRAEAAMSYYEVFQAEREIAVMKETVRLLQDFRKVAQAMYSAGQGRQADVLRAGVEVARMEADIRRMEAMRTAAAARLNAALNQPADAVVGSPVLPPLPLAVPALDTLRSWADEGRPMLARGKTEVEQAGSRVALAKKEIIPDFTVGIQYGQRRSAMNGTERMGSVMLGFSVPLFAGRRQLKMREEAEAMRLMAQSDLARMRAQIDARIVELVADLERNRTLVQLYQTEVLPQAEANAQSSLSSYRVGAVDFMTLVDAQMTTNKYKQELAALIAGYGASVAELEMTIGRELPVTGALIAEGK
ncbi:MAG TPA: TolC family protein [Longimicrobiales bacterium]|nr:TolC family protein [Longimicrobiales bacterium]